MNWDDFEKQLAREHLVADLEIDTSQVKQVEREALAVVCCGQEPGDSPDLP